MRDHHERRWAQAVIVEVMLGIPGGVEACGFRRHRLLHGVTDHLLRGLVIAALLGENEYAEFHGCAPQIIVDGPAASRGKLEPCALSYNRSILSMSFAENEKIKNEQAAGHGAVRDCG